MKHRLKKKKRGFADSELYNLDYTICKYMIPRLKRFKQINIAYPGTEDCPTPEKWDEILDKMIKGFEMAQYDPSIDDKAGLDLWDENGRLKVDIETMRQRIDAYNKEKEECLQLFVKYFNALWI